MPTFSPSIQKTLTSYIKKIEGLEHVPRDGGFLLAANHNNHLDSFILSSIMQKEFNRPLKVLSRKNITIWRIIGQKGADRLCAILIDPKKKGESLDAALEALKQDDIIAIYPEAQLNDKPYLLQPRSGTARLALWTGYPVVPVGISDGPGANLNFHLLYDILFKFKNSTTIKFGKPLQFTAYKDKFIPKELLEQVSDQIMTAIAPLCGKTYKTQ